MAADIVTGVTLAAAYEAAFAALVGELGDHEGFRAEVLRGGED